MRVSSSPFLPGRRRFYRASWSKCTSRVFRKIVWRNPDVAMFPAGELLSFSVPGYGSNARSGHASFPL